MDIEQARLNMVEQQIRPWNVLEQDILDLLFVVHREDFVPSAYRSHAFTDMDIPLNVDGERSGESMLSPKLEARMLQHLEVRKHETVLEIGAGSGYMAALLAHRARRVVSYEILPRLAAFATANLEHAGIGNAEIITGDGAAVMAGDEQFDAIMLSGAVSEVPTALLERLAPGGRLIGIVGEEPVFNAELHRRLEGGAFASEKLFETAARALQGFPIREAFAF